MIIHPKNGIPIEKWIRPQCWVPIPYISSSEQVVYITIAIYDDDSNYFACLCRGAYTVDTGDGTITNKNDNTKFEYKYNYSNVSKLCIRGYKTALIKITPQAGQNLTVVNLQQYHSDLASNKYSNVLEVVANLPNGSIAIGGSTVTHSMLENIDIRKTNVTSIANLFYNCIKLNKINVVSTNDIITYTTTFATCGLNVIDDSCFPGTEISGSILSTFNSLNIRQIIPTKSMQNVTTTTSAFGASGNISKLLCPNMTVGFSVASQKLSATALNNLANSLGNANGAQIINISGNIGTATCTQSLFTNKGYTLITA